MSKELCKLDIALAIDEFEEENVDKNLRLLVQDYYQYYRTEIEHAKKVKDTTKMKLAVHTLKSTSRYLCCEYFALKCQNIEDIVKHTWDQIDKIYEEFIQCYEWFYEDAREKYETMQKEKEEKVEPKVEVKQEVVEKAKDVEVKGSDVSIKLIETKGSNSSIHSLKILKRNSTIKEESDEAEEPICRKTEESKNLDINGKYSLI
jgi:HPt (histidine-containing phosphotransfer) domain-containing protein